MSERCLRYYRVAIGQVRTSSVVLFLEISTIDHDNDRSCTIFHNFRDSNYDHSDYD